jgi:hypothetical protein
MVLTNFAMNEVALEMGVFYVLVLGCCLLLLNEVKGDSAQLNRWLISRKLYTLSARDRNPQKIQGFLTSTTYFYLVLPIVSLIGWNGLLFWDYLHEKKVTSGATSIWPIVSTACVTVALFMFAWGTMILVWNQFSMNAKSMIM